MRVTGSVLNRILGGYLSFDGMGDVQQVHGRDIHVEFYVLSNEL
jgi:hypothetical protein